MEMDRKKILNLLIGDKTGIILTSPNLLIIAIKKKKKKKKGKNTGNLTEVYKFSTWYIVYLEVNTII